MKELTTRAISGILYVALLTITMFSSPLSFYCLIIVFAGLALWEFQRLIKFKSIVVPFVMSLSKREHTRYQLVFTTNQRLHYTDRRFYKNRTLTTCRSIFVLFLSFSLWTDAVQAHKMRRPRSRYRVRLKSLSARQSFCNRTRLTSMGLLSLIAGYKCPDPRFRPAHTQTKP